MRRHLLPLPVTEIHRVLDAVSEQWGISAPPPPDARPLTLSEFVQLASSNVVTIGDHTVDHVRLRGLEAADQQQTIASSKERLERLSGQAILHFAYPFGGKDAFDDHSVDAVRSAGFETACTTIPGNASSDVGPVPPPAPSGKELESTSFQDGPGALETGPQSLISEPLSKNDEPGSRRHGEFPVLAPRGWSRDVTSTRSRRGLPQKDSTSRC